MSESGIVNEIDFEEMNEKDLEELAAIGHHQVNHAVHRVLDMKRMKKTNFPTSN